VTKTFVTITYRQRLEVLDTLERLVRVTQDWREPYAYRARLQFATNRLKQYITDWVVETETDAQYLTRMRVKWAVEDAERQNR